MRADIILSDVQSIAHGGDEVVMVLMLRDSWEEVVKLGEELGCSPGEVLSRALFEYRERIFGGRDG